MEAGDNLNRYSGMNLRKGGRRLVVVVVVVSNGDRVRGITGTIPFYKFIFPRTRAKYK